MLNHPLLPACLYRGLKAGLVMVLLNPLLKPCKGFLRFVEERIAPFKKARDVFFIDELPNSPWARYREGG